MTHIIKQLDEVGLMDKFFRQGLSFADETSQADVILKPDIYLSDYINLFTNMDIKEFNRAINYSYVKALNKISHIRANYGIEREFERYYQRLLYL